MTFPGHLVHDGFEFNPCIVLVEIVILADGNETLRPDFPNRVEPNRKHFLSRGRVVLNVGVIIIDDLAGGSIHNMQPLVMYLI